MALIPGTRLGVYEVTELIGEGGMGQVYRATDTTLGRQVAIKILPDAFAADPERLARFEREAKTLASLNHPHIAAIYAVEKSAGMHALVMELVEGDDLSQRIARGAIPLDEALPIAQQIAEALEAAHEQGIIHRDLKPANIKVRDDGTVKVLDFGLAKAMEQGSGIGDRGSVDATHSPTITTPAHLREGYGGQAMTQAGMILGTAAYMAPEQAKGKTADKRADIWAFGCVLYEMLSGRPPFTGETVSETLADVMKSEPTWKALPASLPGNLNTVIRRCLVKDPRQRIRDVGDVRLALEGAFELPAAPATSAVALVASRTRERIAWTAALAVVSLAALALAAFAFLWQAPADVRPTRFFVSPPDGWRVTTATGLGGAWLAVSPDGLRIAFLANTASGGSRLWVRALDALTAQELPGTDGASAPFWSPDSRSLGFFADGRLKKIEVSGGPVVTLCATPEFRGGAWNRDGVIIFSSTAGSALQKVSASGGVPSAATVLGEGENYHTRPSFLPDGRHFVYRVGNGGIYVTSLDSTARTLLIQNPSSTNVLYSRGHLLFLRETTLMAQPFDFGRLTLTGEPVPIAEQVQTTGGPPTGLFSASDTGVLVYQTGIVTTANRQLTWFDRTGKLLATVEKPGLYNTVALSPNGTRVAFNRDDSPVAGRNLDDLWVHEFARSTSTRLTFDPTQDWMAVWSPDGSRVAWTANRDGNYNLYQKGSNGTGADEVLLKSSGAQYAYDWSPDGRFLLYGDLSSGKYELWVVPLTGDDRKPTPYLQTAFNTGQARFSPDSQYVAYTSNASGRNEVYVQPFPAAADGKWMVSQGGGSQPRWRRDGKELFYVSADSKVMAVEVAVTPTFTPGVPKALFAAPIWGAGVGTNVTRYDVTADGKKFLINVLPPETTAAAPAPITVVLNWTAGLKP